jgi:glutathione-independent formaldehyde dehydrogenase
MEAVVLQGRGEVAVAEVEDARIEAPTDALLRVTSSAICGTDLHFYGGRMDAGPGLTIGHEPLGVVVAVGDAVVCVRPGDRVVVPTHICCGFCAMCVHGESASCLTANPGKAGAAYGYPGMGGYRGAQADLLRVPFADANCLRLPGHPDDRFEHDFVLLADALPTGYHATVLGGVRLGASVAIYGAGAVGLLAALCAIELCGAADVYVVDSVPERLEQAGDLGATPIDLTAAPPVEQIREHRAQLRRGAWRRSEEPLCGVDCAIDAIGFQARGRDDAAAEDPLWVLDDLVELLNPNGRLGIVGVYPQADPQGALGRDGRLPVRWGPLFAKSIVVGTGRDHDERYNDRLRDLIVAGRLHPGRIVTQRLRLRDAPEAYERFAARRDGFVKVVLEPGA